MSAAEKAIKINPNYANTYNNRAVLKFDLKDEKGACDDFKKAASLGSEYRINWLKTEQASWCRYMWGASSDWREASYLADEDAAKWVRNQC